MKRVENACAPEPTSGPSPAAMPLRVSRRRVLGVDPGTRHTGWGLVERCGREIRGIDAGVISVPAQHTLSSRLLQIHESLLRLIDMHAPDALSVESVFYAKFPQAAIKLGHVRGVVLLAGASRGVPVFEFPPATVKHAIVGRGAADKEQVGRMVSAMLGWRDVPALDATDALALAILELRKTTTAVVSAGREGSMAKHRPAAKGRRSGVTV